jgi:hypothetical protein
MIAVTVAMKLTVFHAAVAPLPARIANVYFLIDDAMEWMIVVTTATN